MTTYTLGYTGAEIDSRLGSAGTALQPSSLSDLAQTWNDAGTTFTAIKMNVTDTASASGSLLMDLQVGGVSKFSVSKTGTVRVPSGAGIYDGSMGFFENTSSGSIFKNNNAAVFTMFNNGTVITAQPFSIQANDIVLARDAANTLAQRNSTNPQAFNLYNTYTDGSNYERASFTQTATGLVLDAQYLGTGTEPDNILELKSGGASQFSFDKNGKITVAESPAAFIEGDINGLYIGGKNNLRIRPGQFRLGTGTYLAWGGAPSGSPDLFLSRSAANVLVQYNGTNPQEYLLIGGSGSQRLSTKAIKEAVTAASGASVTTTISIPKYSQLIGVTTRVTTDLGDSNGTTGYTVGDGSDADLWGDITGITAGTTSDAADFTAAAALGPGTADRTITLTATGGNFDGTGVIEVCAFYLRAEAD